MHLKINRSTPNKENKMAVKHFDCDESMINAPIHGNFFENRVTDYAKGALGGTWDDVWAW